MTKNAVAKSFTLSEWPDGSARSKPYFVAEGEWADVTPPGISLDIGYGAGSNYGIETVGADSANPGHLYFFAHLHGLWKSTDYGLSWTGPINSGTNGSSITAGGGGITVVPVGSGSPPIIYAAFIRGGGTLKSSDGGVNWTRLTLPGTPEIEIYPPAVDPYDPDHIIAAAHEGDSVAESFDAGATWVLIDAPVAVGGTAGLFFINTGSAPSTGLRWLWMAQAASGADGTHITDDGGATWTKVDDNEHSHGVCQIFQPGTDGVLWMSGVYSALGWGLLRSTDYGATWTHYGPNQGESVVWGTANKIYAGDGGATPSDVDPKFILADAPGTGTWSSDAGAPTTIASGAQQVAIVDDGSNNVFLCAMGNGGIWRYVEPAP